MIKQEFTLQELPPLNLDRSIFFVSAPSTLPVDMVKMKWPGDEQETLLLVDGGSSRDKVEMRQPARQEEEEEDFMNDLLDVEGD